MLFGQRNCIRSLNNIKNLYILAGRRHAQPGSSARKFHTRMKAASRIGPHSSEVLSVIVGSLLGDGYGNRRSVEGTRVCFRQSIIHKEYLY